MYSQTKNGCMFCAGNVVTSNKDAVLVVDMTSVHGLERAVIIIVPEVAGSTLQDAWRDSGSTAGPEGAMESDSSDPQLATATGGQGDTDSQPPRQAGTEEAMDVDREGPQRVEAALASLGEQCRKDVFYIGSRAVCQLVLIHLATEPGQSGNTS